jgi:hypothetical protein
MLSCKSYIILMFLDFLKILEKSNWALADSATVPQLRLGTHSHDSSINDAFAGRGSNVLLIIHYMDNNTMITRRVLTLLHEEEVAGAGHAAALLPAFVLLVLYTHKRA